MQEARENGDFEDNGCSYAKGVSSATTSLITLLRSHSSLAGLKTPLAQNERQYTTINFFTSSPRDEAPRHGYYLESRKAVQNDNRHCQANMLPNPSTFSQISRTKS